MLRLGVKIIPDELLNVLSGFVVYFVSVLPGYIVSQMTYNNGIKINARTKVSADVLHPSIAGTVI